MIHLRKHDGANVCSQTIKIQKHLEAKSYYRLKIFLGILSNENLSFMAKTLDLDWTRIIIILNISSLVAPNLINLICGSKN